MTKKLPGIEFFRFYFMVWICLYHIWTPFSTLHTNIAVEFFFLVAGVFIYKSLRHEETPGAYAFRRFKRLFPSYFIGILLAYGVFVIDTLRESSRYDWLKLAMDFIPDSLMLQETGAFYFPPIHTATWFVGVLFIGGILLYSLLAYNRKLALYVLLPFGIIGIYTLIFGNGLHIVDLFATENPLPGAVFLPLARGIADMGLGILLAALWENPAWKVSAIPLDIAAIAASIVISAYGFFIKDFYEPHMVLLFSILVMALLNPESFLNKVFNGKVWLFLGGISYEMLLTHIPCRFLINYAYSFIPHYRNLWILFYIALTVLTAYLLKLVVRKMGEASVLTNDSTNH